MKLKFAFLVSILSLSAPIALFASKLNDLDLYLLIGQSNMAGRAPIEPEDERVLPGVFLLNNENSWEAAANPLNRYSTVRKKISMQRLSLGFSFAETMAKAEPNRLIGLVMNARGGTKIEEWAPGEKLYREAVKRAKTAQKNGTFRGIIWHQGEGNSRDLNYLEKFDRLVETLRKDLGDPDLPVVAGQVEGTREINALLEIIPAAIPNAGVALSRYLKTYDGTHFDSESTREFGKRYAAEMIRLRRLNRPAAEKSEWRSLFDRTTFDGWEGDLDHFRIEKGAIAAGNLEKEIPQNEFLCTIEEYEDFELELEFKLVGKSTNSGVQFRSKRIPKSRAVSGYQADLGNPNLWGSLYDESRRDRMLAAPDPKLTEEIVNQNSWNHYRIRAKENRIQLWINGIQTVDYTEEEKKIAVRGIIGLQIHAGSPGEAWFRNIRIREIR